MKFYQKLIGLTTTGAEKIIEFDNTGFKFNGESLLDIKDVLPKTNEQGNIGTSLNKFLNLYVKNGYFSTLNGETITAGTSLTVSKIITTTLEIEAGLSNFYLSEEGLYAVANGASLGTSVYPFYFGYFSTIEASVGKFVNIGLSASPVTNGFFTNIGSFSSKVSKIYVNDVYKEKEFFKNTELQLNLTFTSLADRYRITIPNYEAIKDKVMIGIELEVSDSSPLQFYNMTTIILRVGQSKGFTVSGAPYAEGSEVYWLQSVVSVLSTSSNGGVVEVLKNAKGIAFDASSEGIMRKNSTVTVNSAWLF